MREATFQSKVIGFLKKKGCYTIKINQDAKSRSGDPDVVAFKEGWWGWFEVKESKTAKCRPLQPEKIAWAKENSYGVIVYPENFEQVKKELEDILK